MSNNRLLLVALALVCLQLPSIATAQTFITAWGSEGSGNGQFGKVVGVAVGGTGDVYVSDGANARVQVFTSDGTYLRQWSVPTPRLQALNIAIDAFDNVYVAAGNMSVAPGHIFKYTSVGDLVTDWPSNGNCVAVDAIGNVYVTTFDGVGVYSPSGALIRQWNTLTIGPDGLAIDGSGNVIVADRDHNHVQKYTSTGTYLTQWGMGGTGDGQFNWPVRIAVGPLGTVYVVDNRNYRVQTFTSEGSFITKWGSVGASPGQFDNPIGIAVDSNGNIYVADTNNIRVQKFGFAPTPTKSTSWGRIKAAYR